MSSDNNTYREYSIEFCAIGYYINSLISIPKVSIFWQYVLYYGCDLSYIAYFLYKIHGPIEILNLGSIWMICVQVCFFIASHFLEIGIYILILYPNNS